MEFDAIYQGLITGEEKLALVGVYLASYILQNEVGSRA